MNPGTPSQPPASPSAAIKSCARYALLLLLAGYVIFNRPFAKLGFPPIYIGEMALGVVVLAAIFDFKTQPIRALWPSRALKIVALFALYGCVRIGIDSAAHGLDAARDGVICIYALFALLAPALLRVRNFGNDRRLEFMAVATLLGGLFAGGIFLGWIPAPSEIKVDFLTLATALGAAAWFCAALASEKIWIKAACAGVALGLLILLYALPNRTYWPVPILIAILTVMALGFNRRRALMLAASVGVLVLAATLVVPQVPAAREKIAALFNPDDSQFKTPEGRRGAHSVKWRLVFWKRCVNETFDRAPVFGLGFGTNLTDLLRNTPEWPMFEDSQNSAKYGSPNRHPHSAHVTVFSRLGLIGLVAWIVLLVSVFAQGLRNCWFQRDPITRNFWTQLALLLLWSIYVLGMSLGVVLENPFGGIPFWVLTGMIASPDECE